MGTAGPGDQSAQEKDSRRWAARLRSGLQRSAQGLRDVFVRRKLDAATIDDLEDLLIAADLGTDTAAAITERLAAERYDKEISAEAVRTVLAEEVEAVLGPIAQPLAIDVTKRPHVILMAGVNGSGKTTTIGKLAARLRGEGRSVLLVAGDTFRAAAIDQLKIWATRTGAEIIARQPGADAAGLAFDALQQARDRNIDVVLIDTAGRLQNHTQLMAELEKIIRVIGKFDAQAPHSVLLTLDATTGQNALAQVDIFGKTCGVTGLVMTKLDGTAKGGILVAIARRFGLPVHFIGVGEGIDDLNPFTAGQFARAIAGLDPVAP